MRGFLELTLLVLYNSPSIRVYQGVFICFCISIYKDADPHTTRIGIQNTNLGSINSIRNLFKHIICALPSLLSSTSSISTSPPPPWNINDHRLGRRSSERRRSKLHLGSDQILSIRLRRPTLNLALLVRQELWAGNENRRSRRSPQNLRQSQRPIPLSRLSHFSIFFLFVLMYKSLNFGVFCDDRWWENRGGRRSISASLSITALATRSSTISSAGASSSVYAIFFFIVICYLLLLLTWVWTGWFCSVSISWRCCWLRLWVRTRRRQCRMSILHWCSLSFEGNLLSTITSISSASSYSRLFHDMIHGFWYEHHFFTLTYAIVLYKKNNYIELDLATWRRSGALLFRLGLIGGEVEYSEKQD